MLTSILQRFGLIASQRDAEPLQSRADQNTRSDLQKGPEGSAGKNDPKASAHKRQAVKTPVKTSGKVPGKTPVNSEVSEKPQPTAKATTKPSVKSKAPIKTTAQPVVRPAQPVAGTSAAVKKSAEPVVKAVAPRKPAASKPAVKPASGVASSAAAKPAALQTIKLAQAPIAVKPAKMMTEATISPAAAAGKKTPSSVTAPASSPPPSLTERSKPMTSPVALKPGRRSSARAPSQLPPPAPMVPTHAPGAAKASYSTMTERVIAPPPHVAAKKDPKLANNWKAKSAAELTDDEVKAMPDAEYMNDKQMAFFRHKLSVLKQEIHNSAGETTEHLREETVVVPDPADRATIEEEHALELRTRDRERKLLKKIEQSIGRIDSGDYGYCDETGEPIGVGRLIARPTANLSLEAQQRRELKQKMFGD